MSALAVERNQIAFGVGAANFREKSLLKSPRLLRARLRHCARRCISRQTEFAPRRYDVLVVFFRRCLPKHV